MSTALSRLSAVKEPQSPLTKDWWGLSLQKDGGEREVWEDSIDQLSPLRFPGFSYSRHNFILTTEEVSI